MDHYDKGDYWGYIDKAGQIVIKPQYDEAHQFSEGLAAVKINGKFSYIDISGKEIIKTEFGIVGGFSDGMAKVMDATGSYGYIDKEGRLVVGPQFYPLVDDFRHGLAMVNMADRNSSSYYNPMYGYINNTGKFIWPPTN